MQKLDARVRVTLVPAVNLVPLGLVFKKETSFPQARLPNRHDLAYFVVGGAINKW